MPVNGSEVTEKPQTKIDRREITKMLKSFSPVSL